VILRVGYDSRGSVSDEILADGTIYHFDYVFDESGKITEADMVGPKSQTSRVTIHGDNYSIEKASLSRETK
jgi:hypothetical protein